MNFWFIISLVSVPILTILINEITGQIADGSNLRVQPGLDQINILDYLNNEKRLKLQIKCILFDGPCDVVGHWIKPRVKGALLGECLKCTEIQKGWVSDWMGIIMDNFPELYRAAVAKYIEGQGVTVSYQDQQLVQNIFSDDGWQVYSTKVKQVIAEMKNKNSSGNQGSVAIN